ncbi:hypothetical protein Y032_0006g2996 [Ancylostoma ceylanicum]|uniref:Uncharacterized protein n=1 Tax=Ancylostoma ceylanicum TaxID=53326 RepID=A0A016VPI8_9BILA|nr:hypothetical protein Y032_0006g2996 [Ancylostoma ceylanicum]
MNAHVKKINDEAMQRLRIGNPHDERIYKSINEAIRHEGDFAELCPTEYILECSRAIQYAVTRVEIEERCHHYASSQS